MRDLSCFLMFVQTGCCNSDLCGHPVQRGFLVSESKELRFHASDNLLISSRFISGQI